MFKWLGNTPPAFDQDLADTYVGKYILMGITILDYQGSLIEQIQRHGVIASISPEGMTVRLKGVHEGEVYVLPPDITALDPGDENTYVLRSTGETIDAPDLMTTWTITKPQQH